MSDCETCGGDGIVITWVYRECDGIDLDPETHDLCPDCTVFYTVRPPWADFPVCQECEAFGMLSADGLLECVACARRWSPTDDERIMAERAHEAMQALPPVNDHGDAVGFIGWE